MRMYFPSPLLSPFSFNPPTLHDFAKYCYVQSGVGPQRRLSLPLGAPISYLKLFI